MVHSAHKSRVNQSTTCYILGEPGKHHWQVATLGSAVSQLGSRSVAYELRYAVGRTAVTMRTLRQAGPGCVYVWHRAVHGHLAQKRAVPSVVFGQNRVCPDCVFLSVSCQTVRVPQWKDGTRTVHAWSVRVDICGCTHDMVPVLRSCQCPIWIWLLNYLHVYLIAT